MPLKVQVEGYFRALRDQVYGHRCRVYGSRPSFLLYSFCLSVFVGCFFSPPLSLPQWTFAPQPLMAFWLNFPVHTQVESRSHFIVCAQRRRSGFVFMVSLCVVVGLGFCTTELKGSSFRAARWTLHTKYIYWNTFTSPVKSRLQLVLQNAITRKELNLNGLKIK